MEIHNVSEVKRDPDGYYLELDKADAQGFNIGDAVNMPPFTFMISNIGEDEGKSSIRVDLDIVWGSR